MNFLIVFMGAGVGGAMRHGVNSLGMRLLGTGFPYATLTVNIVGSLAMGLLAGWFAQKGAASQHLRLFLMTGILGGFTTFSSFSLDIVALWERGAVALCALYAALSVIVAIGALFFGLWMMRQYS
ncbi:MAG: fluoride efflux transporter CrcB [Hyphomicrobiales bacterium]|nr:fluoride efflux transporter CrcB [Hyphomicrobiales bacterium]